MNVAVQTPTIDLAQTPAFRMGTLDVRPQSLEVVVDGGGREPLERRVMQVLVALAERRGGVVSRDELNELCWGGRVVGDDALQRCVSRLRKLGRDHRAFDIQSVRGVGLRLVEAGGQARRRRLSTAAGLVAALLVLALAALAGWRLAHPPALASTPGLAITTFNVPDGDPAARELADNVADDIRGLLLENVSGAVVRGPGSGPRTDMNLDGAISRDGDSIHVRATLTDRSGAVLWIRQFARPVSEQARLRDEVAVGASEAIYMVLEILRQPVKVDAGTMALYVGLQDRRANSTPGVAGNVDLGYGQVLARAPKLGLARGSFALGMNDAEEGTPAERARGAARVHAQIDQALRDSPEAGGAYDALYWLTRHYDAPDDLSAAEDVLLKALARAPKIHWTNMRECRFLMEVGRLQAAQPYCARGMALRPTAAPIEHSYASALYAIGDKSGAKQAIERFARYHPEHFSVRRVRFETAWFEGDFAEAKRLLHSLDTLPPSIRAAAVPALEQTMEAERSGTPAAADRALAALRVAVRDEGLDARYLIIAATRLGRLDDAFAALAPEGPKFNTDFPLVFLPFMATLRKDPRFWDVAKRAGYVRYWRKRQVWPDFCLDPHAEVDCPAAMARAGV